MEIVAVQSGQQDARIDSRALAEAMSNEHRALIQLIRRYQVDFEAMGQLTFEMSVAQGGRGGMPQTFTKLNEPQSYFLLTLVRNTEQTVSMKRALIEKVMAAFNLIRQQGHSAQQMSRPPVITVAGMARAYSRPLSAIPVWLDTYRLTPAGYAENPDTGKPVLVYWLAEVEEAFRGAYPEGHTRLRPYSGAWEPGPVPAEKIPLTAREARQKWHAEQRRYRLERDRAEERRLALKS